MSSTNSPQTSTSSPEEYHGQDHEQDKKTTVSDAALDRFVSCFEKSSRRWEIMVYPSLFAFILLAGYGFFLIYSLTDDVHTIAHSLDPNMGDNMMAMTSNIGQLAVTVDGMTRSVQNMDASMTGMASDMAYLPAMHQSMERMVGDVHVLAVENQRMGQSMVVMTNSMHSAARPMNMFNNMMPF